MISVGFGHTEFIFRNHQELELFMSERGYNKDDVQWYDEPATCLEPHGFPCRLLDLKGGEEPCDVCKAEAKP